MQQGLEIGQLDSCSFFVTTASADQAYLRVSTGSSSAPPAAAQGARSSDSRRNVVDGSPVTLNAASALSANASVAASRSSGNARPVTGTNTEKSVDPVARWVAICGLVLGIINVGFAIWKVKRDRRISVEDDFWFRKIVTPAAIEPILATYAELSASIPDRTSDEATQKEYAVRVTTDFQKLLSNVEVLALFDPELPDVVTKKLSASEDLLTDYIGELANSQQEVPGKPDLDVRRELWKGLNAILADVKIRHLKQRW